MASSERLQQAGNYLLEINATGFVRQRIPRCIEYVTLNTQQIFDSLVDLYTVLFGTEWHYYSRSLNARDVPTGSDGQRYAARVYISTWLHDLYYYIRDSACAHSLLAVNEHYTSDQRPYSREYDSFLSLLNASIRPTHIQGLPLEAMYIPLLSPTCTFESDERLSNPYNINGFVLSYVSFQAIIGVMNERKRWCVTEVPRGNVGRPCWLFDWHEGNQVCSWFPRERNYDEQDLALAYIVGVACSPKMGCRDVDEWQFVSPDYDIIVGGLRSLGRVVPRKFAGAYEVRTIEDESAGESGFDAQVLPKAPRYARRIRISDWTYYGLVIMGIKCNTRLHAYMLLSYR